MDFQFQKRRSNAIPEKKIYEELEKAAEYYKYVEFSPRDFNKVADISYHAVIGFFGTWLEGRAALKKRLQEKGLDLSSRPYAPNRIYSNKELFDEMERIWHKVRQRPSRTDWGKYNPKIRYDTYTYRFNGWSNACLKFIEYKMGGKSLADDFPPPGRVELKAQIKGKVKNKPEDSRNVSDHLRVKVWDRDKFRCCYCGKSPATDLGTQLQIDHKTAFSKGGKSTLENLQTLCAACNHGKSNQEIGRDSSAETIRSECE